MTLLVAANLRSFCTDRIAVVLTLVAPVAFFTLMALFYRHLESADGLKFEVVVVDSARNQESVQLVEAMQASGLAHLTVRLQGGDSSLDHARTLATVQIPSGFSREAPRVEIRTRSPFPGAADAAVQLVQTAAARAFGAQKAPIQLAVESLPGMLLRTSAAGIALIFVMFSAASIAGRGLGDDAAGLAERLRSLGVSRTRMAFARMGAMTVIAWVQVGLTLAWAAAVFGVMPASWISLIAAAGLGAAACTAFISFLALATATRARFAAVAPVVILVVSAVSGSMIPRVLLPDPVANAGAYAFPAWAIDACSAAIEGGWAGSMLLRLALFIVACMAGTWVLTRRRTP